MAGPGGGQGVMRITLPRLAASGSRILIKGVNMMLKLIAAEILRKIGIVLSIWAVGVAGGYWWAWTVFREACR